jgi:hypothetical protein
MHHYLSDMTSLRLFVMDTLRALRCPSPLTLDHQLKKKHPACAYHRVREAIAGGIMNFVHIKGTTSYANMLSKPLSNDAFHGLIKPLLFHVPVAGKEKEGQT